MLEFSGNTLDPHTPLPLVMGILNTTPDSFSDGGRYLDPDAAIEHGLAMIEAGAAIVDVGAESTRPGAKPVAASEQIDRCLPVIEALRRRRPRTPISIDTRSARVAAAAIEAGVEIVNDVSALTDDEAMSEVVASSGVTVILMHMQGRPATMQRAPRYEWVVDEVLDYLVKRAAFAEEAGVRRSRIVIDPGIGFGKTTAHNVVIMQRLEAFIDTGYPVLLGASRKRFLGDLVGKEDAPATRLPASLACAARALSAGVTILRVHDVRATRAMLDTLRTFRASPAALRASRGVTT